MEKAIKVKRRYPLGAEIIPNKGVHFRLWAPDHSKVRLILENEAAPCDYHPMKKEAKGYFSCLVPEAKEGSLYRFELGTTKKWVSDPASRFQPQGVFGPSCVIDPNYSWRDQEWRGVDIQGQIIYEMHIGTFTPEGTFQAGAKQLQELSNLGITLIELMPLNDFYGHFGWGYDGVNFFAPSHLYGTPNDLKFFIDEAHRLGLGVIHDVVYNHLGLEGNQLFDCTKEYIHKKEKTDWGQAINFDSSEVREYFLTNAKYWIEEFHFDGLRIDATPWFFSSTKVHILSELSKVVKKSGRRKKTIIIGENEPQNTHLLRPYRKGGYGFDALWNDDFHHSAHVRLTGMREAYYTDYLGTPQEFVSSCKYGFLFQGQYYAWQKKTRGIPHLALPNGSLIVFLENHDQIANSGVGFRLHQISDPGNYRALTALLLLNPHTPMLFQGQEFGATTPFLYFADHSEKLSQLVFKGHTKTLSQFPSLATEEMKKRLPNPEDPITFMKSKLDFKERNPNSALYQLHKDLIYLRRNDSVFKKMGEVKIDGAVLGSESFLIRYFGNQEDRLLIINFGPDTDFNPASEPLLVAGLKKKWKLIWSSQSAVYGGKGTPLLSFPRWKLLGHSANLFKTVPSKKRAKT